MSEWAGASAKCIFNISILILLSCWLAGGQGCSQVHFEIGWGCTRPVNGCQENVQSWHLTVRKVRKHMQRLKSIPKYRSPIGKVERGLDRCRTGREAASYKRQMQLQGRRVTLREFFFNTLRECRDASRFKRKSSPGGERLVQCNVGRSVNVRKRKRAACYTKFFW